MLTVQIIKKVSLHARVDLLEFFDPLVEFHSYDLNYSNYSRVPLTSNNNLTFGTASRIITTNQSDNNVYYNMNIDANLYVLGGNVYDDKNLLSKSYWYQPADKLKQISKYIFVF